MPVAITDLDAIVHLDFEPERTVPCIFTNGGEHPAVWVGTFVPCGHAHAYCSEHRAEAEEVQEEGLNICAHGHPTPLHVREILWAWIEHA